MALLVHGQSVAYSTVGVAGVAAAVADTVAAEAIVVGGIADVARAIVDEIAVGRGVDGIAGAGAAAAGAADEAAVGAAVVDAPGWVGCGSQVSTPIHGDYQELPVPRMP